jgi:hypothetical protein
MRAVQCKMVGAYIRTITRFDKKGAVRADGLCDPAKMPILFRQTGKLFIAFRGFPACRVADFNSHHNNLF